MEKMFRIFVIFVCYYSSHYVAKGAVFEGGKERNGWWELSNDKEPIYPSKSIQRQRDIALRKLCLTDPIGSNSWKYRWGRSKHTNTYLNESELCDLIGGNNVMLIGDSLSLQQFDSWQARTKNTACFKSLNYIGSTKLPLFVDDMDNVPHLESNVISPMCANKIVTDKGSLQLVDTKHLKSSFDSFLVDKHSFIEKLKNADIVIINEFTHIPRMLFNALKLHCDIDDLNIVFKFWEEQLIIQSKVLSDYIAMKPHVRKVFYRSSPASGGAVCLISKDPKSINWNEPLSQIQIQELDRYANDPRVDNTSSYGHTLYKKINEISKKVYSKQGLGYIDLSDMMGARIDAHPIQYQDRACDDIPGDSLHYCMPGVPDISLDLILEIATSQ